MGADSTSLVLEQLSAFGEAVALGAVLGACYDVYRAIRLQGSHRPAAVLSVAADCLFWVAATVACILTIVASRWGEVHLYTYLGLAAGILLYFYCLSRFLLSVWVRLFSFVGRVFSRIARICGRICRACAAPVWWCARRTRKAAGSGHRKIKHFRSRIIDLVRRKKK